MLRRIFILLSFILGSFVMNADPVTPTAAQKVAENFYLQNSSLKKIKLKLAFTQTSGTGKTVYYVFNVNSNDGFVIVSADNVATPIIGYSTKSSFVVPDKRSPFHLWMDKRKNEISSLQENQTPATEEIKARWESYKTANALRSSNPNSVTTATVSPLVQSIWNQEPYYNDLCPGGSVTGCVATAMAQIMRYWSYPSTGKSSSSYCDCSPNYQNNYGTLSANYGAATYNWANMPLDLTATNTDVATINYHCGVSVQMDYSPSGSGAWVITADDSICAQTSYVKYFKYDPNTIQGLRRSAYTDQSWIALLKNDLNLAQPIQYVGWDPSAGGHTWVCDGYDASDYFHMNWGWGGQDDGFFSINLLNPGGFYTFSQDHQAVIGIKPMATLANDAGVQSIITPNGAYCANSVSPIISLENFGTSTLTSCTIKYYLDNQAVQTYSWTGSVLSNQATNVSLPSFTTTAGTHTLTCYTSDPNNAVDSNSVNDQSVSVFVYGVKAGFTFTQSSLCGLPSNVQFTNSTLNGSTYSWNFGDGGTSTTFSPTHSYTVAGTYQVKLVAQAGTSCPSSDSITATIYVTNGPHASSCNPSVNGSTYYGVTNFSLNTINNSSGYSTEGYKDFTCTNSTNLVAGNHYTVSVSVSPYYAENFKIWIDYNNDGIFNNSTELAYSTTTATVGVISGVISTPTSAVLNTPLRLRVIDETSSYAISGPCYNPYYGQAEDYAVIFTANSTAPVCDFVASTTTILQGNTISFTDLSNNVPTSWNWTFTGAVPSGSSTQNPSSVTYNTLGNFPVKLKVSNAFGSDSLTKTAYIHVVSGITMCSATTTSLSAGTLFDSGGPGANYSNNENCSLLIDPGCAQSITLSFQSFNTEYYYDILKVYDGPNASGTLLLNSYGTSLPNSVTANSGQMFITWTSNATNAMSGFQASWTSVMKTNLPPVAQFVASLMSPPFQTPVSFTDNTTQFPNIWSWNFGDGSTSTQQNPTHTYLTSGTKTVTLIATNCVSSDTIQKVINVQASPAMQVWPDTLRASVNCSDSAMLYLKVKNTGGGKLVTSFTGTYADSVNILVFTDNYNPTDYANSILAIKQYFQKIRITLCSATTAAGLQAALNKQDVLLFPAQYYYVYYFSTLSTVVQNFASQGGVVIVTGSSYNPTKMYDMGLFTGSSQGQYYQTNPLNVLDTSNIITKGLPLSFTAPNYTYYHSITNFDKTTLVTVNNYDVVTYRNVGSGRVIYVGFDYYMYGTQSARLISNAVKSALPYGLTKWITMNKHSDTVNVSSTDSILVKFKSAGNNAGQYVSSIIVQSNDTANPYVSIPCIMDVHGSPGYAVNPATCISFGNVMQYTSKSDSVVITNTGCDTLKVTSISAGLGVYTFSPSAFIVLPSASKTLRITFSPQITGAQNSSLTLNTNAGVKTICVSGTAYPAPTFDVNPKDISVNLSACGSFTTVPVAVQNSGQGVLLYSIPGAGGIQSQDTVHVLIMTSGVDMSYRYPNMITAITQNYSKVSFTQHSYTTPSALSAALQGKKVLLFPSQVTGVNYYTQMASVVQNFASSGGIVIVCGSTNISSNIYDLGLFTGSYASYLSSGYSMSVPDTSNPVTKGLPLSVSSQYYTIYHSITSSDKTKLISYGNYDVAASRTIGSGKAIYIGYDYYSYDANSQRVLANAVKSGAGTLPAWTSLSTAAGNVASNAADTVFITLSSNGLTGGIYSGNIIVQSNDPRNPSDTISCTLNVLYNPCANFMHHIANGCGSTVTFADSSVNLPNSWHWNFGDGSTSTQANPSHTYTTAGTYTVKLKVCNSFGCDSISKTVTINPGNPPAAPLCTPVATNPCCGIGIYNVHFNTINNSSGASTEGYKDFTCTQSTTVVGGQTYTLTVTTGTSYYESVSAWIDYNNNGVWETSERVLSTANLYTTHTATVIIPTNTPQNTPLRMRVGDDNYTGSTGCSTPYEGQYEDYTVLVAAAQAPSVNFSYANTNTCSGTFSFTDLSTNGPTTWSWNFGDGSLSSVQNPTHTYSQPGTYTVTLVASNSYGTSAYYQVITASGLAASINVVGNTIVGDNLSFSSTYTAALSYSWNFGDGSSSGAQNPSHTYSNPGTYIVSLTLVTQNCVVTKYDTLNITLTGIASFTSLNSVSVSPNPFAGSCMLSYALAENSVISLDVLNVVGQVLLPVKNRVTQSPGNYEVPLTIDAPGIYFLRMEVNGVSRMYKIVRQ